jgi:WD40 repeat protein
MPAIGDLKKHLKVVHMMCFSPDGRWLASSSRDDRSVWVWDFAARKAVHRLEGFGTAFSPDSRRLATSEGPRLLRQAAVWDVESGKALLRLVNSDSASMRRLVFTADGAFVVATGLDKALRTWDVRLEGADDGPP